MRLAGATIAAEGRGDGRIANLRALPLLDMATLSWSHVGAGDPQHRLAVLLDGELVSVLPAGVTEYSLAGLADGVHRFEVVPVRPQAAAIPDLHGAEYGRRAYLRWDRATDADVAAYRVYRDSTLVATLDDIDLDRRAAIAPTSGSGAGRVSILGSWTGTTPTNASFAVRIDGSGEWAHNMSGSWSDTATFVAGGEYELQDGVRVRFESAVGQYVTNDQYAFTVGPPTRWTSDDLSEDTYSFEVTAVDAAGNESDALTALSLAILHRPGAVTDLAAEWDGSDIDLTWTLPDDDDLDAVLIYANESNLYGTLADEIIETGAWVELADDATSYSFTPSLAGTYRFYVRTRDTAGRLSDLAEMVVVDTTEPSDGIALELIENLTATAQPDGQVRLSWQYNWTGGESAAVWAIYTGTSESALQTAIDAGDEYDTVSATAATGVVAYTFDTEEAGGFAEGTRWFAVRAGTTGAAVLGTTSTLVSVVVDATAPTFSGDLQGAPN